MRQCPQCNQLIQDAAVHCRFCAHDVNPTIASSEEWTQFGKKFHRLSAARQQTAWDGLSSDDQLYVQKAMGIVPPSAPGIREALADLRESREARKSGNFSGLVMVASLCVLIVIGVYFLLPVFEASVSHSDDGVVRTLATSERINKAVEGAVETVTALLADFGGMATNPVSSAAVDVASDTQPGATLDTPPNP